MTEPVLPDVSADAMRRLARLDTDKPSRLAFTSDLSVDEFLLVEQAGFRPLGLVLGSSIYYLGIQVGRRHKNMTLERLSSALYDARDQAMTRMQADAERLGADGIVGVRLQVEYRDMGTAEVTVIGTAVKAGDTSVTWRNDKGRPFTSDLGGQDFWALIQAGYAPVGMVMGVCVREFFYDVANAPPGALEDELGDTEIPELTQTMYDARELAMSRMQAEARALHAEGVVGVSLDHRRHAWGSSLMEFLVIGTAVRPIRTDHTIALPRTVLELGR